MRNNYGIFFRFIRFLVRVVYPRYHIDTSKVGSGPTVYISHHQNLFGPFITLLWFPAKLRTWILHVFLDRQTCYRQYAHYTFSERFGWNKYLAQLIAFPVARFITLLLTSGQGIPVYRSSRKIMHTFQDTLTALENGEQVIIFPDIDYTDTSAAIKSMYEGFLNVEKFYYKKHGIHINFVPLYASKGKRIIVAGQAIRFREGIGFKTERKYVYDQIHKGLNQLAAECGDAQAA